MNIIFLILLSVLVVLFSFYGGVIVGVKDCKRRFGIPVGCSGVNGDGEYY